VSANDREPQFWWVNQNQTYAEEIGGGFMWSPKRNANGARNQYYDNMTEVQPGDVVFSFSEGRIRAIGRVTARAQTQTRPEFRTESWSTASDGWFVETDFVEVTNQIRPKDHIESLRETLPVKYSPLQHNGNGIQSVYLASVPRQMANILIGLIGEEVKVGLNALKETDAILTRPSDSYDTAIIERTDIGEVEQIRLLRSRRGQGVFKRNVMLHESSCRVTGVSDMRHLRASHIKPWRESSDQEKLSGSNGLLLAPHIDHLFDRGWISFGDREQLLVSRHLTRGLAESWGMDIEKKIGRFTDSQAEFLEFHRARVFRK
jgi:putative restriction endonuclease